MRYFKLFDLLSDYESYIDSSDYLQPNVSYTIDNKQVHYNKRRRPAAIDTNNYLTMVALEDGLTASLSLNAVEYCVDGDGDWKTLPSGTETESINAGQTLSFRANLTPKEYVYETHTYTGIGGFSVSKKFNLEGNCMSLLFGDDAPNNFSLEGKSYAFHSLFNDHNNLISVSKNFLPATTLSSCCYYHMFSGCRNLISAPELPATILDFSCYEEMFSGCTDLTVAPELPAITLADRCYESMFSGCTGLKYSPKLPAIELALGCYSRMFYGTNILPDCSNIDFTSYDTIKSLGLIGLFCGTKVTDEDLFNILPINSEGKYCLPVMKLCSYCYEEMFANCTLLKTAPELPGTEFGINSQHSYRRMFAQCTSLTTPPKLPATKLCRGCYEAMFYTCTSLTTAPELPATTLEADCYKSMFYDCENLSYIKMLGTNYTDLWLLNWVYNVSTTGTFVKNSDMNDLPIGQNGIPVGWTVENAA